MGMTMKALALLVFLLNACAPAAPAGEATRETFTVWLCPVHEDQQAAGPGACPICQLDLVERLLVTSHSCVMHPQVDSETPGACPICNMELVASTRQLQWYCPHHPNEVSYLPGGICAETGEPMVARAVPMAHGDHNPRHGGVLFMTPDRSYHLEGVLLPEGEFRLFLYDEQTEPVATDGFVARIGEQLLEPREEGAYLSASFARPESYPADVVLYVRFPDAEEESRFDFSFVEKTESETAHHSGR